MPFKNTSFFSNEELKEIGFKKLGKDCLISRFARFYYAKDIELGDKVRIDDFCILSGKIKIGSFVHISAYCALHGSKGIIIGNFCGASARTTIYSEIDDFSGEYLINPMIPKEYTNVSGGIVKLCDFVQLGNNTTVMPNITLNEGAVTGAYTFVNADLESWIIYAGIPAKIIKTRKTDCMKFVKLISELTF